MAITFQLALVNAKVALGVANRPANWHEELHSKWYFETRVDANGFDFIVPMQNEADGTRPKLTLDEYLRNAFVMADCTVPAVGKKMNMRPSGYWAPQ